MSDNIPPLLPDPRDYVIHKEVSRRYFDALKKLNDKCSTSPITNPLTLLPPPKQSEHGSEPTPPTPN